MKSETGKGKVETAYGQPQPKEKQEFTYPYRVFETVDEAAAAGFNFLELANSSEKSNEKSKAYQKAIEWAKPDPNDPVVMRKGLIANMVKMGVPEEVATKQVDALLAQAKK